MVTNFQLHDTQFYLTTLRVDIEKVVVWNGTYDKFFFWGGRLASQLFKNYLFLILLLFDPETKKRVKTH